jgi:hypothetical protein
MTCRRVHAVVVIGLLGLALCVSCNRRASSTAEQVPAAAQPDASAAEEVSVLLSLPLSAYHASIAADDGGDVLYLLTSAVIFRVSPGHPPGERRLDLGSGAMATRSSFVHWSGGSVFEVPKGEGEARRLVALAERPQQFVASEAGIAWLRRADDGRFSLHALVGGKPRRAYASPGSIDAVAMIGDAIFFVERPSGSGWRIGRVRATGGAATFTSLRDGRAPAMLAGRRDVTFYDGNRREVHRLSLDLQQERTLASNFVCSPLAVTDRIYCAQVEGIFELRPDEPPRRLVPGSTVRLVTELAATATHLYWIVDAGPEQLELRSLALGG